jgi:hypothetical protein
MKVVRVACIVAFAIESYPRFESRFAATNLKKAPIESKARQQIRWGSLLIVTF